MTAAAPYKRKLIEVALPLDKINEASSREKSIRHGHPSTLHLWWARRPLAACRAVLFASLVDDPSSDRDRFPTEEAQDEERQRLFRIIERLVQWENTTNEAVLEEARAEIRRSTGGNPPPVLDPFCGGGSIPLEAQRLGLTAYASDLNPVAVLITKALVEIPPKFANLPPVHPDARRGVGESGTWKGASGLAEDVRRYGAWMRDEAERRIGHLYPKVRLAKELGGGEATVIAWLWARTVTCPNPACGAAAPLIRSFTLSSGGRPAYLKPEVDRAGRAVRFAIDPSPSESDGTKLSRGGDFRCLVCETIVDEKYIKAQASDRGLGAKLLAAIATTKGERIFLPADTEHERVALEVKPEWGPDLEASRHPQYMGPPRYGLTRFRDMFSARQLVALATFSDLVQEARERAYHNALAANMPADGLDEDRGRWARSYADSVATYLAFAVDRGADYWSTLAVWAGEFVAHTFGRNDLPMVWDYAEAAPLEDSSGGWPGAIDWICRVLKNLPAGPDAHVIQADATRPIEHPDLAMSSTDPPYYDNVPYADLSDYFYVWLRRCLSDIYPALFATVATPKAEELVADSTRYGGRARAARHFEVGLRRAFEQIRVKSDPRYPTTVYYAFKQSESRTSKAGQVQIASTGWETMLDGLIGSGLEVVGTWPMRTERPGRLRQSRSNALASSIVLVCRPRAADAGIEVRREFVGALRRELPIAMRAMQRENIAPVDLAQSSIGPGMAIFSRYARILEPDGTEMAVGTALGLINQVLDEILADQEGEFDADTRWAIAWYDQYGHGEGPFGTADVLARAKNRSVEGLVEAGIASAQKGRVRLLTRDELGHEWDPVKDRRVPVWEAMQRVIRLLVTQGETPAGELLARLGGLGEAAHDLAYRLYQVAERRGRTDEARAYNALVVAWSDLSRSAEQARMAPTGQTNLGLQ